MTRLKRHLSEAVVAGRWSISSHADDRAAERNVEVWQIVEGFGESVVAVWAYDKSRRTARLVTVYFEDR